MANTRQSGKRARQAAARRARGQALRSRFRTELKKARAAVASGDEEKARKAFAVFQAVADRTAGKGGIHANNAARVKRRLGMALKNLSAKAEKTAAAAPPPSS